MQHLREILAGATRRLEAAGVYSPAADAAIIISAVLETTRENLKQRLDEAVADDWLEKIELAVRQREARIPIARIFGRTQFRGLSIKTGDGVFEPCIETETLIDHLQLILEKRGGKSPAPLRMLDIGTGTGCLLLSALNEIPQATGIGVDISEAALFTAHENAVAAGLDSRAEFRKSDWIENVMGTFDIILSNPPFVPTDLIETLVPEVRCHDPKASLDGGRDGLRFYRMLARDFIRLANPGGVGIFHVSMTFAEEVKRIFNRAGYADARICRNYYGVPMCLAVFRDGFVQKKSFIQRLLARIGGAGR